jgi:SWIM zinc finger
VILSNGIKELNVKSRNIGKVIINKGDDKCAEVSEIDSDGNVWRHAVKLERQECTCREWKTSGQPCIHAIAFIFSIRGHHLEDCVHDYYSVSKFRVAYIGVIRPMSDKSQWIKHDSELKDYPLKIKRPPDRPRKKRFLIILRRDTKNNNVRDVRSMITKKEHAKIHYMVMQKMPWILE